jgi:DNA-binding NarL/FixJ family response regulator
MTSSRAKKGRVFVVDDHPIVREGISALIDREPDLTICGAAEEARTALEALETLKPDILIVDISLNGPTGLELVRSIRARDAKLPVLILSMHDECIYAERALRAGANGYVMKQEATEKVIAAVRRILGGEIYVSERVANKMLQRFVGSKPPDHSPVEGLTDRELEVFLLIGEGRGTRQIADELHVSIKTVESYQAHIKEKMSLKSGRELVQQAIQWKLTGRGESPTTESEEPLTGKRARSD